MVDAVATLEQAVTALPEYVILRYGLFYGPGTWYERTGHIWSILHSITLVSQKEEILLICRLPERLDLV